MKRIYAILLCLSCLLYAVPTFATGTNSMVLSKRIEVQGQKRIILILTMTADGSASFANYALNPVTYGLEGWYLESVETDPGTAPTTLYDMTISDAYGYDVAGGLLTNRSATVTEKVYMGSVGEPIITGSWTVAIANNAVNNAVVVVVFVFKSN